MSIWHAPLPMLAVHAETADGVDDHDHEVPNQASEQHSACEFQLVLPCQLHGCEHSSLPHDDSDHSRHMASMDYGALGESEVELDLAADCRAALQSMTLMAISCHPSQLLNSGTNRSAAAHLADADDARALPLRANLQVFLI
ncbi:MAG: hypothetical protein HON53_10860 [Planctomycetaceae bacterium]|nr:hypothetical protein [Planctomycetaceae bacterium]MBT6155618.1 hypothetical protein [Planctomycetaceae bacterium]MBT6483790.1 hypothetical protein [Planctomycetaceae bacterium]MBT6496366.1 hypothetical protein [Planctomycetaceae bacterium]